MAQFKASKFPGVRYREHKTRKRGIRFDRYFMIRYQKNGKQVGEGLGWASEGWTEKKASETLSKIKEAIRTGIGPQSLKESRELARQKRDEKAEKERQKQLSALTFSIFFNDTYLPLARQEKKPESWKTEISWFTYWIEPVIGNKPFGDIAPIHVEKIKSRMLKAGKAPRSVQYCLATIRQVFNVAIRHGVFAGVNPTKDVKIKLNDNKRRKHLTEKVADSLLAALFKRSGQLYDMALLSLRCGLRAGEIFALTWNCVDFEEGILLIKDAKGGKSRYAYMTADVKEMLDTRWKTKTADLVFVNSKGGKIKEVSRTFAKTVKALGLNDGVTDDRDKVVFHTLRHTFASWLVQNGEPLYTVAKLMGHSTIAMTERYSHLAPDNMKAAVERMEARLKKQQEAMEKPETNVHPLYNKTI